jgi:hypothetical protein
LIALVGDFVFTKKLLDPSQQLICGQLLLLTLLAVCTKAGISSDLQGPDAFFSSLRESDGDLALLAICLWYEKWAFFIRLTFRDCSEIRFRQQKF